MRGARSGSLIVAVSVYPFAGYRNAMAHRPGQQRAGGPGGEHDRVGLNWPV